MRQAGCAAVGVGLIWLRCSPLIGMGWRVVTGGAIALGLFEGWRTREQRQGWARAFQVVNWSALAGLVIVGGRDWAWLFTPGPANMAGVLGRMGLLPVLALSMLGIYATESHPETHPSDRSREFFAEARNGNHVRPRSGVWMMRAVMVLIVTYLAVEALRPNLIPVTGGMLREALGPLVYAAAPAFGLVAWRSWPTAQEDSIEELQEMIREVATEEPLTRPLSTGKKKKQAPVSVGVDIRRAAAPANLRSYLRALPDDVARHRFLRWYLAAARSLAVAAREADWSRSRNNPAFGKAYRFWQVTVAYMNHVIDGREGRVDMSGAQNYIESGPAAGGHQFVHGGNHLLSRLIDNGTE